MTGWQMAAASWVFVAGVVAEGAIQEVKAYIRKQVLEEYLEVPYIVKFTTYWVILYVVCLCWPAIVLTAINNLRK